jgi:hypothetical protein
MIVLFPQRGQAYAVVMNASSELPLPGAPAAIDRLSRNAGDALLGETVAQGTSMRAFYLVFDLVALALVALAALGLVRAVVRLRRGASPRRRIVATVGVVVRAVGALLLLALPVLIGYGWSTTVVWSLDLGLVLLALAALLLATAVVRLLVLLKSRGPSGLSERRSRTPDRNLTPV